MHKIIDRLASHQAATLPTSMQIGNDDHPLLDRAAVSLLDAIINVERFAMLHGQAEACECPTGVCELLPQVVFMIQHAWGLIDSSLIGSKAVQAKEKELAQLRELAEAFGQEAEADEPLFVPPVRCNCCLTGA